MTLLFSTDFKKKKEEVFICLYLFRVYITRLPQHLLMILFLFNGLSSNLIVIPLQYKK